MNKNSQPSPGKSSYDKNVTSCVVVNDQKGMLSGYAS